MLTRSITSKNKLLKLKETLSLDKRNSLLTQKRNLFIKDSEKMVLFLLLCSYY